MENTVDFLKEVLRIIGEQDPLHMRTLKRQVSLGKEFNALKTHICTYFEASGINPHTVADDYLRMIGDMRREGGYFMLYDKYSCKNQAEAYEKVYSKPEIMRYYINALLISQLLWKHHFNMLRYFRQTLSAIAYRSDNFRVLDVGSGHGLFSWVIKTQVPSYGSIDILDISTTSLEMTRRMIGDEGISYLHTELSQANPVNKYELIILGEILEHMDDPIAMLQDAMKLLSSKGMIFFTVPTNAPAIDHVYLFRNKADVMKMIEQAGLTWITTKTERADSSTELIGALCIKK